MFDDGKIYMTVNYMTYKIFYKISHST